MKDFFDRLDKFMKDNNLNDNKVTVCAGLSVGSLGKQRKGARGLSSDSIAKLLYAYPLLNADWLLTGRGEMLNNNLSVGVIAQTSLKDAELLELQRYKIKSLEAEIKELKSSTGMGGSKYASTASSSATPKTEARPKRD